MKNLRLSRGKRPLSSIRHRRRAGAILDPAVLPERPVSTPNLVDSATDDLLRDILYTQSHVDLQQSANDLNSSETNSTAELSLRSENQRNPMQMFFTATADDANAGDANHSGLKSLPVVQLKRSDSKALRNRTRDAASKRKSSLQWTESSLIANELESREKLESETNETLDNNGTLPYAKSSASPSMLAEVLLTAAHKQSEQKREQMGSPKLNVFTTLPRNFTRFVMKVGPLATFQDKVESLLLWDNPTETLLAMCGFSLICLNPRVLLFVPHFILLSVLARNYYQRAQLLARGRPGDKHLAANINKKPVDPSSFKPDQISYKKNMQFIQNTMGMYSDAYENLRLLNTKIDWSDSEFTMRVMRWTIVSGLVLLVVSPFIPWNIVVMLAGLTAFVMNTALGKATVAVLCKNLEENGAYGFCLSVVKSLSLPTKRRGSNRRSSFLLRHSTVTIECVENQRWWAGLGWIPHMLKTERGPWSNYRGDINTVAKDELIDPLAMIKQGFAYEKPDVPEPLPSDVGDRYLWRWTPESTWAVSTQLCAGSDITDEDGWVYTDHNWAQPEERDSVRCLTRRRRWIRQAQILE